MYEEYFGLKRSPFRITPDTSLFYDGGHRGDILGALVYAVHRGEGIIKVVGEVGSGKTMLCRMLQQELPETIEIIYIANPSVSPEDILFVIASELKFDIVRDASKHEVVTMLHNYLLKRHAENKQVVLFVEEAQSMPLETLEEIRLLSNLETDRHKLLQIILFGQPELDENLANNSIRQLRERITHDFNLSPLTGSDIHQYLNFRMREVGYTGPELINQKLATKMAGYSDGLLRRINILADKMLLSAFADGTHTLTAKHLLAAVKDSGFSKLNSSSRSGYRPLWLTGVAVLLLAIVGYAIMQNQFFSGFRLSGVGVDTAELPEQPVQTETTQSEAIKNNVPVVVLKESEQTIIKKIDDEAVEAVLKEGKKEKLKRVIATATEALDQPLDEEVRSGSKKNQQSIVKLDMVENSDAVSPQVVEKQLPGNKPDTYQQWLQSKIESSKEWLRSADKQSVSIQVMMRNKSAARDLALYLQTDWPLDLEKTYLYEVKMKDKEIFRVFYGEYPSITSGQTKMKQLPESVRANSPYLHSVYRMQKALL